MAMILLEAASRILAETVHEPLVGKGQPCDVRLCDFDDVSYRVTILPDSKGVMKVSMSLPSYQQIREHGAEDALKRIYGSLLSDPVDSYDVTLTVDLENLPCPAEELTTKISLLRSNAVGGVFDRFLSSVTDKTSIAPFKFDLRSDTTVYFIPGDARLTVVYDLNFHDRVDQAVARVFLPEFAEGRRQVAAAPPVQFNENPPLELKQFDVVEPHGTLGFVSFAILPNHVNRPELKERVVQTMPLFRNYLQYHIKCSKAYFHSRMRARVVSLLQVLNRAKSDVPDADKQKKTITGKNFQRKVN